MWLPYVPLVAVAVLAGSLQGLALASPCGPVQTRADACVEAVGSAGDGDVRHLVAAAGGLVEAAPLCAAAWQCLAAVHYNLGDVSLAERAFRKVRAGGHGALWWLGLKRTCRRRLPSLTRRPRTDGAT